MADDGVAVGKAVVAVVADDDDDDEVFPLPTAGRAVVDLLDTVAGVDVIAGTVDDVADDIVDDKATTTASLRESQDWQK